MVRLQLIQHPFCPNSFRFIIAAFKKSRDDDYISLSARFIEGGIWCIMALDFQNQMFVDLLSEDGLMIAAR